jgi:ribosomal protein L7Ae-like RNA K-turn-binding protein
MMQKTCHISGAHDAADNMLRFVHAPDNGVLTPDLGARLPGDDIWVMNRKNLVATLAQKNRAIAPADLAERVEALMRQHLGSLLALARKAGALVIGFTKTEAGLKAGRISLLIAAYDGAQDGRRKLANKAKATNIGCCALLSSEELGMALGQSNVIHAGLTDVGWAERINRDAGRLAAYLGDTGWENE